MSDLPPPSAPAASSPVPLPSPPPPDAVQRVGRRPRRGELIGGWYVVFVAGWAGVILGLASVWKTSRTMGLSTWWLGSTSDPRFLLVQLAPFAIPAAVLVASWRHVRRLPLWGALAACLLGGVAARDLATFDRLAVVEFVLAGAALAVSLASWAGVRREE